MSKKIGLLLLFSLLFFFYPRNIYSQWLKHANNPVITLSESAWDSESVRSPSVIYDEDQFKLYYQGQTSDNIWKIGLALSPDGINWTKNLNNLVLTPSDSEYIEETGVEEPSILKNSIYHMWYKSDPTSSIRYATSNDGKIWQKYAQPVLTGTARWENRGVANPSVIFKDGKYWMYYTAWGVDNGWLIGLATSNDGINWTKYENNPLKLPLGDHIGRPAITYLNNKLNLFYHTGYGRGTDIYYLVSDDGINFTCLDKCSILKLGESKDFDSQMIIGPSVIEHNSQIYLYYGGTNYSNQWKIGLASQRPIIAEDKRIPIVILPGMFASWNKEAILHNQTVDYTNWKLQNCVKEYDGLVNTLKNIGYAENVNLFIFPYDWRQPITKTVDDLKIYLQTKIWNTNPNQKISFVGHSLGGLIGRIFTQENKNKINKIVSVGSPHHGVIQVYKPLEAGEIDKDNTFLWLAEKVILFLNKSVLENDRTTIANKFPVVKDLFPTFNFLKDFLGNEIPIENVSIKNSLLLTFNQNFADIFPIFTAIYGEKGKDTPNSYIIKPTSNMNKLLGNYEDGEPQSIEYNFGDDTVLSKSASQDSDSEKLSYDHGEIITKKEGIKKILDILKIKYSEDQIIQGQKTVISPSIIFMIRSPAIMTVEFNNTIYVENDGIIYIPDAKSGTYNLKVQGTDQGKYEVVLGQISENNDIWEKINGEIVGSPPSSQIDNYFINYDNKTAFSIFPTPTITPTTTPTNASTTVPTSTPGKTQTSVSRITNFLAEVLGTSSANKSINSSKNMKKTNQKAKKNIPKKYSALNFILPEVVVILGVLSFFLRKKIKDFLKPIS